MLRVFLISLTGAAIRWEVTLVYNGLDVPTRQILDSRGAVPTKTAEDAKKVLGLKDFLVLLKLLLLVMVSTASED
ncbi:hypothetical protein Tco_1231585 [Tanacetum coccineum]